MLWMDVLVRGKRECLREGKERKGRIVKSTVCKGTHVYERKMLKEEEIGMQNIECKEIKERHHTKLASANSWDQENEW